MKIVALVPAFNEALRLAKTIRGISEIKAVDKIVVINDGSTDQTSQVVRKCQQEYPVELVELPKNMGKGQALNIGWQEYPAEIYLLIDADLEESAALASALLEPVINQEVDMTIANFVTRQVKTGKMGFGLAKSIASWGIKRLTGVATTSPLSGQRAVRQQVLKECGGFAAGFGVEVELTIKALRLGYQIREIDLPMTHRPTGRNLSGFMHRGKQLWMIIKVLVKAWRNK